MSDYYGHPGKEEYLKELHQKSKYSKQPKRIRKILDDVFNEVIEDRITYEQEAQSLMLGSDLMQYFLPLDGEKSGIKRSSSRAENERYSFFCWYEPVIDGSDFFNIRELDANSVFLQIGDVSGFGAASGIVTAGIQYICTDHFLTLRNQRNSDPKVSPEFRNLLLRLNDIQNELPFRGRVAALQLLSVDTVTGDVICNNAGFDSVWQWSSKEKSLKQVVTNQSPAIGAVDSKFLEMQNDANPENQMYHDSTFHLDEGDILFTMSDGVEESYRNYRNIEGLEVHLSRHPDDDHDPSMEFFGSERVTAIVAAALTASTWDLIRHLNQLESGPMTFDFQGLDATPENAVLAVTAVEKVFRIVRNPSAGGDDIIKMEKRLEAFLKNHFTGFDDLFNHPLPDTKNSDSRYSYYSHLVEDPRQDDYMIMGYQHHGYREQLEELTAVKENIQNSVCPKCGKQIKYKITKDHKHKVRCSKCRMILWLGQDDDGKWILTNS